MTPGEPRCQFYEAVAAMKASQERKRIMEGDEQQGAIPGKVIGTIGQVNVLLAAAISTLVAYRQAKTIWQQQNPNTPSPFPEDQELINLLSSDAAALAAKANGLLLKYGG